MGVEGKAAKFADNIKVGERACCNEDIRILQKGIDKFSDGTKRDEWS